METKLKIRLPMPEDGMEIFELIKRCPPLDQNSSYCNLLQASHFANTSVIAEQNGSVVGFVSGYILPEKKNTLFIWQVAVDEVARGQGLALKMIDRILNRIQCKDITFIETTITESNLASWGLFESIASRLGTELNRSLMFDKEKHFAAQHDTEMLARIGPLNDQWRYGNLASVR